MNISEALLAFIVLALFFVIIAAAFSEHTPISKYDLDLETCEQARAAGWTEKEIKKLMADSNGHYIEANQEHSK
jgi:hypothetical protein